MSILNNIIILTGPTGSGKTDISIKILQYMPAIEIISADSMQIYKGMNIGTAKPNRAILETYNHHCIDIIDPNEKFDVMKYSKLSHKSIQDILSRNRKPLIVGGSGLYIKSFLKPLFDMPGKDINIRINLIEILNKNGNIYLYNVLKKFDPHYADKISCNDTKRIIRALEVYYLTGKPISYFHKLNQENISQPLTTIKGQNSNYFTICLYMNRNMLYQRINKRVNEMFEKGFLSEVEKLMLMFKQKNIDINSLQSMQGLGYKQVLNYLDGKISEIEMIEQIKKETRHFAKRQISWFKNQIRIDSWINLDDYKSIESCAEYIISIMKKQGY